MSMSATWPVTGRRLPPLDRSVIYTFSGTPGSGKSTAIKLLLRKYPDRFRLLKSYATRPPRGDELPGEYEFVTLDEFEELYHTKAFAWTVPVHGHRYGTTHFDIAASKLEPQIFLAHLAPQTYQQAMPYVTDGTIVPIYLLSPGVKVLKERCGGRGGMTSEQIARRMAESKPWDAAARESAVPFRFVSNDKTEEDFERNLLEIFGISA